jgi:hypothetical protein
LFFLDDSAVLFSEPRQELHEFNTMAAVIWCHLEDGKDRAGIAAELVSGMGVGAAEAARFVDLALDTWSLQGLLRDRSGPSHAAPRPTREPPADMPGFGAPAFVTERCFRLLSVCFRLRCTNGNPSGQFRRGAARGRYRRLSRRQTARPVPRHGGTAALRARPGVA